MIPQTTVTVGDIPLNNAAPFALIAGPCQLETLDHARKLASAILEASAAANTPVIFKASFDKANRTSFTGPRGPGLDEGLTILSKIRAEFNVPVLTDIHLPDQARPVAEAVDMLQIPAFLCRQTDLLVAAGETQRPINVKKGQFLAPWDMQHVADKIRATGNDQIMLCERGTSFGYNTLVNDMRALPQMAQTGLPVCFDATHSVQSPGGQNGATGGDRRMVPPLARAAIATGCAALFLETHDAPDTAPSDGPNMLDIADLPALLGQLRQLDSLIKPAQI